MVRIAWTGIFALMFFGITGAFAGSKELAGGQAIVLQPDNPKMVAVGGELYKQSCASCHGLKLGGQPNWKNRLPNGRLPAPPHDQTGHTWHHNDALLFKITKLGTKALAGENYQTDMRGFADELSDHQILSVLSYIKSTWPEQIRMRHDQMNKSIRRKQ